MSADYGLGRGYSASIRLNLQHFLWRQQLGYNLHPLIPTNNPELKIADVATGTGAWLFDVALSLPNAQVDGFDISFAQLPSLNGLPRNVSCKILDALGEIPTEFWGHYDIVHSRMLSLAIKSGNPTPLFKNLLSMLSQTFASLSHSEAEWWRTSVEPGGWIQYGDCDHPTMYLQRKEAVKPSAIAWELYSKGYAMMMEQYPQQWTAHLDKYLLAAGASDVQMWRYPIETPFAHKAFTDNQLAAFQEMSYNITPSAGVDPEGFRNLLGEVSRIYPKGADIYYCPAVCIGMKPLVTNSEPQLEEVRLCREGTTGGSTEHDHWDLIDGDEETLESE